MTTHTHALAEPRLRSALTRMFEAATRDDEAAARVRSLRPHDRGALTAQELADANREIYMPISADGGKLLYNLVRATRPANVVEFGTSYGISTLHLAAAVRDNGSGHVITTEMKTAKAAAARDTFTATGLDDVITLLEGNALQTLAAPRFYHRLPVPGRVEGPLPARPTTPGASPDPRHPRRGRRRGPPRPCPVPRPRP